MRRKEQGVNAYEDEQLRKQLLDDIYAGAFSDLPAMLADEDEIKNAGTEELQCIARRYGY